MLRVLASCLLVVSGIATHFIPSGAVNKLVGDLVLRDGEGTYILQLLVTCLPLFIRFRYYAFDDPSVLVVFG